MIAAGSLIAKKKLTIKFTSQKMEAVPGTNACELRQQVSHANELGHSKLQQSKQKLIVPVSRKRGQSEFIECQPEKRQKMDRVATQQCSILLKSLMGHPAGWVFNQPVDPVALNIPDYFTIISKPMDLGTIKSKLQKNQYGAIDEFAADVRLTFSNAMLFNPPTNNVHKMAEELSDIFKIKWKSLEEKWNHERIKFGCGKLLSGETNEFIDSKHGGPRTPPQSSAFVLKKSNPSGGKTIRASSNARVSEAKPAKPAENHVCKPIEQNLYKGTNCVSRNASGSVGVKPLPCPVDSKCSQCGMNACRCRESTNSTSDISSEGSSGRNNRSCSINASKLECEMKSLSASKISKSGPDFGGAVSSLDDENMCPSSQLTASATDSASEEGWGPTFDVQLSPTSALRAAIVKRRFADTILKAQQRTLLDQGDKADPVKMQQEKERLERRQREEKARIEAQIRAAEAATQEREEMEMKKQREREREAARIALQKMEKTAEIEQNLEILKELEGLCGCSLSYNLHVYCGGAEVVTAGTRFGNPLERLGLFMKDDNIYEDEVLNFDGEEGEIFS